MPDLRSAVNLDGIGYAAFTYAHDDTIVFDEAVEGGSEQAGLAVTLESDLTVSLVGAGEMVEGVIVKVEDDGLCVVQIGGNVRLPGGLAATLTAGTKIIGATGTAGAEGYIATAGASAISRGTILDASDPTRVLVRLESGGPN